MITKSDAHGVNVDWDAVNKATEIKRTYLVRNGEGREFFKMYTPSEAKTIFKRTGWTGKLVGILDRSRTRH